MSGPQYAPVPLSTDQHDDGRYSDLPPSPGAHPSNLQNPETDSLGVDDEDLGTSSMRPRFLGRALDDEGHGPRQSYASSGNSLNIADDAQSSVYGLNPSGGQNRDTAYYSLNYRDDPHDSDFHRSTPDISPKPSSPYLSEKRAAYGAPNVRSRKRALILGALALVAVIIIVVVVAIYFTVIKPHNSSGSTSGGVAHDSSSSSTASSASPSSTGKPVALVVTGGDGSLVTTDKGTTFTYRNSYGGYWYWDPTDPFNNGARAQAWSPALNESFEYGTDTIRGVNLGGWLNTEPFITPALYEKYLNSSIVAIDEWTLSQAMTADTAGGGLKQLEDHYDTFITEQDFAQIAAAGLNYVRIPLPYWAIETRGSEPFLAKTCWTYFLKAVQWARKYGIRINLDLHALPGSQNGWNHSGKYGSINVLNGPMGFANAQRSLDYIRIIAEFISQPEYSTVVTMFGVTNEPQAPIFGQENLARYYLQAYNNVRTASGVGENKGPFISFHEGFAGLSGWNGYFTNSDRVSYDIHPYVCFGAQSTDGYDTRATEPCTSWGANQNKSMTANGLTTAGEFSNAINDCGLYVNGVNLGTRFDGTYKLGGPWPKQGDCDSWTDYQSWTPAMKQDIQNFALASMDALQNWFFWTWKIGNSSVTGKVEAPAWSYSLGLQEGWMPKDPRTSSGTCGNTDPWQPPLESWMTGGAGADQIPATFSSSFAWPPTSISNAGAVTLLPSYTQTGTIPTLPAPSFTSASSVSVGNGWENAADNVGIAVAIPTCSYLDPWVGTVAPPSPLCSGAAKREPVPQPTITPPPS